MANPNKPQGFELAQSEGKQYRVRPYKKASGTAIYRGDAVQAEAGGGVQIATTSGAIRGIALESKAATDTSDILICDDPDAVFEVQCGGDFQAADVHLNAVLVVGTPDSSRGTSGMYLNGTLATTAAHQFKILGLVPRGDNAYGSYARVFVKINSSDFKAGVAGV